ncbi:MAG: BREX system P-loop protein BrxC [Candidatus Lokiarchaeota archaeon]|nr:BREX system P-loop protein BrxC [Candidatus Lokiarchaeota archaeon]
MDRQLAGSKIAVRTDDRKIIVDDYPLLPVRRRFWEQVLRAVDAPGTASQLRTQLRIVYDAVRETANEPLGTVMPADFIFDQLQADLLRTGELLRELDETIRKLDDGTDNGKLAKRLCGLIFLIRRLPRDPVVDIGVRAKTDTLADLMVRDLVNDGAKLRAQIAPILEKLVERGILIKIDEEYSLQTRESSEWDREFRNRQTRLNSDAPRIAGIRAELIKNSCAEALRNVKLLQGRSKVARRLVLHFGADAPDTKGHEIPVWVRDEWGEKESTVVADARAAGNDNPIIYVFVKRRDAADLQKAIVEREAAEGTIEFKGVPSTDEARDARNAMATRSQAALQTRNMIISSIIDEAKVFQGGGNESYGLTFADKVKTVAEYSLDRLFRKFSDADDHRWNTVINRAKAGAEDALSAVDWSDAPEKHPVCSAVLHEIGSGCKGKDIRDTFEDAPFGWPRDAIDAALIVLFTTGHARATHKGTVLQKGQLDQAKISVTDFRVETTTLSTRDRIKLRQLFQSVGIQCASNQEAAAAGPYLAKLEELAGNAGGNPPLPSSPSIAHLESLRGLEGNEQLTAILEKASELSANAQQWQELADRATDRMSDWDDVVFLAGHAANLPGAQDSVAQMEAITNERRLLEESNPIPGIRKPLTSALREAVTEAHKVFCSTYDQAMGELEANDAWQNIKKDQRESILKAEGIEPPAKLSLGSDTELINALRQTSLETWKIRTDALPQQFANAAMAAAKLLEPKVQTVKLRSTTLRTEDEIRSWAKETEDDLVEKLKNGPVIVS